jgi:hypothetical protein
MAADEGRRGMKKTAIMGVAALVAAMSLGVAAPANAQSCGSIGTLPTLSTVSNDNGQIRVNPNGAAGDADNAADLAQEEASDAYQCALSTVPPSVFCADRALWAEWDRFVYVDQYTGELVVDYGRVAGNVDNAAACL